jgi:aryl-alcohol dehydrogenase-like predicted oxidoreductase
LIVTTKPLTEIRSTNRTRSLPGFVVHRWYPFAPPGLGTKCIGDAWADDLGSMKKEQAFELLDAFVDAGGNFIDTSNNNQNEQSEMWMGEWMSTRGNRDRLVIATKFTMPYKSSALGKGHTVNYSGNHRRSLYVSLRDSLQKLQTKWIAILYLHWWDYTTLIEEVMDSLDAVVKQGKVLYLCISDTPA